MEYELYKGVFTVGIGGKAGDGVREAGQSLGSLLADLGYEVYISFTYPSLIRGGHNFARISFSREKIWSDYQKLDTLIALNEETIQIHKNELNKNAVVLADSDSFEDLDLQNLGKNAVIVPMNSSVKDLALAPIMRSSVALGALCYLFGLESEKMGEILNDVFSDKKPEINIKLANIGYEHLKKNNFNQIKKIEIGSQSKNVIDGNAAVASGLEKAGLDFYVGYPMTPATSILHYLAGRQSQSSIKVIQPESELAVINMALGMAYAGKRVAIGTATGGFNLMQEAFSFAGISELPLPIIVSQRQAPATGVPTYSSQTDMQMVRHAGHGEFPRIVIAPSDSQEAYQAGIDALNLAWKYQIPVIVLMDKILSEHALTSRLESKSQIEHGRIVSNIPDHANAREYGRYEITPDGISPMAFPGTANAVVKVNSYEHDWRGYTIDSAEAVKNMIDKRFIKIKKIVEEMHQFETVKIWGDSKSQKVIVVWGSTKGPVLEAIKYVRAPVKVLQIQWLEPFDTKSISEQLKNAETIINIECNHNAQMASLIAEKTGVNINKNILKYNSRPFEIEELVEKINQFL